MRYNHSHRVGSDAGRNPKPYSAAPTIAMELNEYPRPANDTGIGVHWTVGYATAVGLAKIREFWLPELRSMGVKWVKIFNHDGALDFCELLLAEGFMPIVRLYRPNPNPGRLGVKELVHLDALVRAGVRYIEFNNEPDVDAEWKGGRVPVNGLDLTVENTIANLELVLERGGMPAIPALANGSRWDLVGRIVAAGHRDLLDGPVWQAIHNYAGNRPLDYPYDIGNQEGGAYTERFFRTLAAEAWGEDAWRGRSLLEVNRLRYDRRNPGATIADDHACLLAYEHFDALNRRHLGRSIPLLSTESGYLVGQDTDPRYPATTPDLHMAQTLETCRVMMGVSQRFKHAPDYYFCTAFWLVGNEALGSTSPWWEAHAWYSQRWPGGMLPIVRALQAEPKVARIQAAPPKPTVILRGLVIGGKPGQMLQLERGGLLAARTALDAEARFELFELEPGDYLIRLEGTSVAQTVVLEVDQREVAIKLDASPPAEVVSRSTLSGTVRGGAGAVVVLVRGDDGAEWVTLARDDGSFRFVDLPPGIYSARVDPGGAPVERIRLDGRNHVGDVTLAVAGWGYTITLDEDIQKIGAIVVATPGHRGLRVQVHGAEWSSAVVETGSAPEQGKDACYVAPLEAGHYIVTVDGAPDEQGQPAQLEARVRVDKRSIPHVQFVFGAPAAAPHASSIRGRVTGLSAGAPVTVALVDAQAQRQERQTDAAGHFAFDDLAAGLYTVSAAGAESAAEIALDGHNQVTVELSLPAQQPVRAAPAPAAAAAASFVRGVAPDATGGVARLLDAVGNERRAAIDASGHFAFDALPAGVYALFAEGGYVQRDLHLDGAGGVEVTFAPLLTVWETVTANAGSMPGYGAVRVEVEGMRNLPVRLWQGEDEGQVLKTGSAAVLGEFAVEFAPLVAGLYMVEPEGLGVWASVELNGLEAMWVSFRRRMEPLGSNQVRHVAAAASAPSDAPVAAPTDSAAGVYLFVAAPVSDVAALHELLRLAAALQPEIGSDLDAAVRAQRVLLWGGAETTRWELEFLLRGVTVEPAARRLAQNSSLVGA
jgi:hypothetical protein